MDIWDAWRIARRNWLVLLVSMLLGLGAAIGYSMLQPTVYAATATAYVVAGTSGTTGDALAGSSLAKEKAATYVPLVRSQQVATRIAQELEGTPGEGVTGSVAGSVTPGSVIFAVTATSSTAQGAALLAEAGIRATAAEVEALETINPTGGGATTTVIKIVPVEQAATPATRISPTFRRNLVIGPAVGLVLGLGAALIRRSMDRRVRTSADAEEQAGVGTLGIIPAAPELAEGRVVQQLGLAAEAMRLLRTNIRFVNVDHPPRSLVITSANPDEGKSTIAAHLALMLAESGQPTILVDADLRRPTQATLFELDGAVGLTQVLARAVPLDEALVPGPHPQLQILLSGRIPPNPSELVGSERMTHLISELAQTHTVIIDAPPLLAVTDAGLLAVASDGALLVVKAGSTLKEQVVLCRATLDRVGGGLLGTVLNLVRQRDLGSAVYGYGYGGSTHEYYPSTDPQAGGPPAGRRRSHGRRSSAKA